MRSDLDQLMAERQIDAFIIPGSEGRNTYRDYLTGGAHASAMIVKKRGEEPILIVNHMEIDEARKSGLPVMTHDEFNMGEIFKKHGRGTPEARAALWEQYIEKLGLHGRVTFYGTADMQYALSLLRFLEKTFAEKLEIVIDKTPDIFELAYETKDADEIEKMREVGKRSGAVMQATRQWLAGHRAQDGDIVDEAGKPLTIGAVKQFVRLKLLEHDLEDSGGMIFAQGRDAGVPHSRGEHDAVLRVGQSIVFDLFPSPIGGGYFHDMTRTWCLGFAPAEVQRDYDLVMGVFHRSLEEIALGEPVQKVATKVCEWFEAAGHPTRLSTPDAQEGYVHSLGHGLGLNIHESPGLSHLMPESTVFKAGNVLTIEPGLYYPEQGYGIRVEDTVYLDANGQLHNLTDCPYDLVIPLKA